MFVNCFFKVRFFYIKPKWTTFLLSLFDVIENCEEFYGNSENIQVTLVLVYQSVRSVNLTLIECSTILILDFYECNNMQK